MKRSIIILIMCISAGCLMGQKDSVRVKTDTLPESFIVLQKVNRDGEVLPEMEIKEITIVGNPGNVSRVQVRRFDRLTYNVRRVYPYAMIVRIKLEEVNQRLEGLESEEERKKYLREFEKSVFRDYEGDMRSLTITQGRILIKLIDRETQNTSFDLIRTYRGGITAAFWQGIARIFGTNLKDKYDPYGEDAVIERIIYEIENSFY